MSNSLKFLAFLSICISSFLSYASDPRIGRIHQFRTTTENAKDFSPPFRIDPKTKLKNPAPDITRSTFHRCAILNPDGSIRNPAAKFVTYSRRDGTRFFETAIPYPDKRIGDFLDTFHFTMPQDDTKLPILTMLHYRKTLAPKSEDQLRAKTAICQLVAFFKSHKIKVLCRTH